MTSASRLGTPRALTIAAALAAVLLVAAAAFLLLGNDAPQRYSGEGVPYIDIDGSTGYRLGAVEIDQTDFVSFPHALDDSGPSGGWYLVKGNIFLTAPLAVSGDVRLIMGSGATLTVTGADNSIAVASGSLSVYAQPKGAMGRVVVTGGCGVELSAGTSLVNTASIASTLPGGCGAHAYGTASITNGATGVIRGGSEGIWLDA
ncbi:MAG: hypothetical protein FWH47_04460, partial [Methanomassiliicoccaceae archaeon]|nr:hypothetical protein [Methanomassiliicoccaceae archaeon]